MSKIEKVRLEQTLLNKQLVQAELEELREIEREIEPQISIHILNAKNLPVQLTPKISRAVQISLDNKTISTKSFTSDGSEHTAKWNESVLLPVKDLQTSLKILVYQIGSPDKVIGGMILKISGFLDQKRHDGWYDIGNGELRLAIRLLHSVTDFYDYLLNILNPAIKHDKKLLKSTRQNKEILDFNPRSKLKTDEKPENSFLEGDSLFDSKADHKIDFFLENFSETNSEIDFLDNDSFDPPKDNISDLCLRQISISLLQKIKIRHISAKKIQKAYRNYRLKTIKNIIKGSIDHALINYDRHVYNEVKEHFENIMTKILDEYEAWEIDKFHSVRRNTRVMNQRRTDVIQKLRNNRTTVRSEWESLSKLDSQPETPRIVEEDPAEWKPPKGLDTILEIKTTEEIITEEAKEDLFHKEAKETQQPPYIVAAEKGFRRRNVVKRY